MVYDYTKYITTTQTQIDKYGGVVYITNNLDCAVDVPTGVDTCNEITVKLNGVLTTFSDTVVDGTDVLESDRLLLIGTSLGRPLIGNTVTIDTVLYRIIEIKDVNPGVSQPVAYNLHLRTFILSADLDVLTATLRSLEIGSIVNDPTAAQDYYSWFVLAHGHHADNITTLVQQRPFYFFEMNVGTPPSFNRWGDTDLWGYLTETYVSRLSVDLNELLQAVFLETGGFTPLVADKISILSLEELTGTEGALGSSGKFVPYFSNDIRRVVIDYASSENTKYWTRDVKDSSSNGYVINVLGQVETQSMENLYSIRPIIFLQGANVVSLQSDGTYEFQF